MGTQFVGYSRYYKAFAAWLIVLTVFACSSKIPPTPEKAYNEAMTMYNGKHYEDSVDAFKRLRELFPDHPYAQEAQLRIGEASFNAEKFDEAVLAYDEFVKMYPASINVPYARYKEALCYYQQISEMDRDQSFTKKAITKLETLISVFPDTPYAVKVYELLYASKKRVAEQELFVGNFYLRYDNYKAAEKRFMYVLNRYPDVEIQEDAVFGLYRIFKAQGNEKKAKDMAETIMFYFPHSKYKKTFTRN